MFGAWAPCGPLVLRSVCRLLYHWNLAAPAFAGSARVCCIFPETSDCILCTSHEASLPRHFSRASLSDNPATCTDPELAPHHPHPLCSFSASLFQDHWSPKSSDCGAIKLLYRVGSCTLEQEENFRTREIVKPTPSHHFQCLARLSIAQSGGVARTGKADLPLPLVFFPIPL